MSVQTLTPEQAAFVALSEHCFACPDCRPDPERSETKSACPKAEELYRTWFDLWRREAAA